jgi:hypothetical protein
MDPLTGALIFFALWGAVREGWRALSSTAGRSAQAGTQRAGAKAAQMRGSPRRRDRAAGRAMQAGGKAAAGAVRGVATGVRAAAAGAREGFKAGIADAERWVDTAPARRQQKLNRRHRRAANRVKARAGWKKYLAQRRQWRGEDRAARQARRDARREERQQRIVDRAHDEALRDHERRGQQPATGPTSQTDPGNGGRPETVQGTITVDEPAPPAPAPPRALDPADPDGPARTDPLPGGPPPDGGHRCDWGNGGSDPCPAPAAATLVGVDGGAEGRYCGPHALRIDSGARSMGETPTWQPTNPPEPLAIEGAPEVSAPAIPTGEIQGKADTERALEGYRGVATTYQDKLADLDTEGGEMLAMVNRLCEQLGAAQLGTRTMHAVAAIQEQAGVAARLAAACGPADEAVIAGLSEFDAAIAAHDPVEAAALANTDGGTTAYHNA